MQTLVYIIWVMKMFFIKEIPESERPRERLCKYGPSKLSNVELLAILLQTGTKTYSVIELSKKLLYKLDSLSSFNDITMAELTSIEGIGIAKASSVIAALELSRRVFDQMIEKRPQIGSAKDIYERFKTTLDKLDQEHFYTVYLDTKNQIIAEKLIYIGTLNQSVIHPREIFRHAVKVSAYGVIFVHNHPSGDTTPSQADIKATHQLEMSGSIMGIQIIDHIIIGKKECYSIKENQKYHF